MFNYFVVKFGLAYIIDLILGDPRWLYHPVIIIGKLISFLEKFLYRAKNKIFSGAILNILTLSISFIVSLLLARAGYIMEIFFLYTTLATKSLADEGKKVYRILKSGDIKKAKKELSYLVSRDTNTLSIDKIIMSVVETIAENTVDGFVSPVFFAFVGSFFSIEIFGKVVSLALPFAMIYKAINTLDSMVGYKNERYMDFGKVSARIDDVANFIPARLTGLIFVPLSSLILGYNFKNSLKVFFRDRNKHSSPNSGQSESAYAGALGIQFGGKISYFGENYEKPKIGDKLKEFDYEDIKKAVNILYVVSFMTTVSFILVSIIIVLLG
ncbi:adenosylcobinamide-phosphate synthase CbiB [Fusobacterium canifelinum]|uniref:Cobalamin biosynthesis protein CobD n=1 Tax=Fusobacterium canifelinum TaxID=285729 RepID=A0A3P1UMQ4_9FUSO|nr:adenosylcobinamide-phosphate synthase CbiB [Fusobacterium canifelinum]QQS86752.1 cobalamin biosynthesis protein CobD [Fusobacterium canifelinum]RRD22670.1 cobalamin biosynthesis protein CobD [Fusobacterium canifelinum]